MNPQPIRGIDATKKWMANPKSIRGWPPLIKMEAAVKAMVK